MFRTYESKIKGLAYYQIAGGLFGIIITVLMLNTSGFNLLFCLLVFTALCLYTFSLLCGVLLLVDGSSGLKLSKINQVLQVPGVFLSGYGFQYASGLLISFGLDLTDGFGFKFNAGPSSWQISINTGEAFILLKVNLVALYLIKIINRLQNASVPLELEQLLSKIDEPSETLR